MMTWLSLLSVFNHFLVLSFRLTSSDFVNSLRGTFSILRQSCLDCLLKPLINICLQFNIEVQYVWSSKGYMFICYMGLLCLSCTRYKLKDSGLWMFE